VPNTKEEKPLDKSVWEFFISAGVVLGTLSLLKVEVTQGIAYAVFGGGTIIVIARHIIKFFKQIDINIREIKEEIKNEPIKD